MGTKRLRSSGTWEYIVRRKGLLPKPLYLSFKTEAEGDEYVRRLEQLLDRGVVPREFAQEQGVIRTIKDVVREYQKAVAIPKSDRLLLDTIVTTHKDVELFKVDYEWVEGWIRDMKHKDVLAPGTIRHYVGALRRCLSWGVNRKVAGLVMNPIMQLPRGYATYSDEDATLAGEKREDIERDRRVSPSEEKAIRGVLAVKADKDAIVLFDLALESAMRMREMYSLEPDQVNLKLRTVFLDKTKNGDKRQVPLTSVALRVLKKHKPVGKLLFPWWDGRLESLEKTTETLSKYWGRIFESAGCQDLHFHDLRHEATSRIFERTTLRAADIAKITGHRSEKSLMRYANLRGSHLAGQLW